MSKSKQKEKIGQRLWPLFLLFFLTNTFFLFFFYFTLSPGRSEAVRLHVPTGSSLQEISDLLVEKGVIKSGFGFQLMTKLRGLGKGLRAGDYAIPPRTSPWKVISLLTTGQGEMVRFTVPEGLTDRQVIDRVTSALEHLNSEKLLRLARNDSLSAEFGIGTPGLMGYMFPDTYFVPPTIDEASVLRLMVERFLQVHGELVRDNEPQNGFTRHETVILASIIEKEAVLDSERVLISSVFLNRLELGRQLESCATVLFVLGKHKSRLLYRDLEVNSPYNTYLHRGLPPGPICNPGRASLAAALYPSDTGYLYFVARGGGSHEFSRSLNDHNRAKRRYQRSGPGG